MCGLSCKADFDGKKREKKAGKWTLRLMMASIETIKIASEHYYGPYKSSVWGCKQQTRKQSERKPTQNIHGEGKT